MGNYSEDMKASKNFYSFTEIIDFMRPVSHVFIDSLATKDMITKFMFSELLKVESSGIRKHVLKNFNSIKDESRPPWSSFIFFRNSNIIFCPIPKNATNSLTLAFLKKENIQLYSFLLKVLRWDYNYGIFLIGLISKQFPLDDLSAIKRQEISKVVFLREPLGRFISAIDNKFIEPIHLSQPPIFEPAMHLMANKLGNTIYTISIYELCRIINSSNLIDIDEHFLPQVNFSPSFDDFQIYDLFSSDIAFEKLFTRKSKVFKLNKSNSFFKNKILNNAINLECNLQDLIKKPFLNWSATDLFFWSNSTKDEKINLVAPFISEFYENDTKFFNDSF